MEYIIAISLSVISGVLTFLVKTLLTENRKLREKKREEDEKVNTAIKEALVCLLRVKLIEYHDKYVALDYIPSYAYDNWTKMFEAYTLLGGNGLIKAMNDDIEKLQIV